MVDLMLEWLNLALRWFHVVAAIAWIGASFYFMWLDFYSSNLAGNSVIKISPLRYTQLDLNIES